MATPDHEARWRSTVFRDELVAWVEGVAGPVLGIEQAKLRPWAAVWRVRTRQGLLYAKQNSPGQLFEAALVAEVARVAPSYVVPVVAVDTERGLLLTPDQGRVFGDTVQGDDLAAWCRLVQRAMELSRLLADRVDALAATGVTRFDRPDALVFFDFADAVLAHPLSGLLVPLNVLADRLGEPGPSDPRLRRVADAALEVWSDQAPTAELRRALPAALRLGCLGRAECWARLLPDLAADSLAEWGGAVDAWLDRLDDPPPVRFA